MTECFRACLLSRIYGAAATTFVVCCGPRLADQKRLDKHAQTDLDIAQGIDVDVGPGQRGMQ